MLLPEASDGTTTVADDDEPSCDLGPGIPPEHHERIFQPFARLDPNEQGIGLGLWLVRKTDRG